MFCSHYHFSITELKDKTEWDVVEILPLSRYEIKNNSTVCGKSLMGNVPYIMV